MRIRQMVAADLKPAAAVCAANGWDGMATHFSFFLAHAMSHPFVAEVDGTVVGTGVATTRGRAGWVGLIAVLESYRRRGIGEAMTRHVMDHLRQGGCSTLLLFATSAGRPLYERLGFEVDTHYSVMSGPSLTSLPDRAGLSPVEVRHLPEIAALDRAATVEDRSLEFRTYAECGGWVIRGSDGRLAALYLQTPWGTSTITAPAPEDGRLLVDVGRAAAGLRGNATVSLVLPEGNPEGLAYLEREGFEKKVFIPRLVWGEPLSWRPEQHWSRISGAIG